METLASAIAVNDLLAAVSNGTAAVPETSADLIPIETADGTAFDGDDATGFTASSEFALSVGVDEAGGFEAMYASSDTIGDDQLEYASVVGVIDDGIWL